MTKMDLKKLQGHVKGTTKCQPKIRPIQGHKIISKPLSIVSKNQPSSGFKETINHASRIE
jgi:hypothetical protein